MIARRFVSLSAILGVFAVPAGAQSPTGMFRGGPAHVGTFESAVEPRLTSVVWKFKTRGKVISSPLLAGDAVIVGSTDHNVYALNEADGTLRWKFLTGGSVTSSPATSGGLVFVGSLDGKLYAIDLATGKARWTFATKGEHRFTRPGIHGLMPRTEVMPDPYDVFTSSPTVASGRVFFGSGDGHVYALDAATGALAWSFATGDVVHATPAVVDGTVYVGSFDRNLYALDAATGTKRWAFQTGQDTVIHNQVGFVSSPAVADNTVYVGCRDGFFYAVDARTGAEKWRHDNHHGWVIASPAVRDGTVFFPTSDGTRFKALDAATGALRFDVDSKVVSFSSPALVGRTIYFGTAHGWLRALDATTGAVTAEFQTDGSKANSTAYVDATGHLNNAALYPDLTLEGAIIGIDRMFSLGSVISSPVVRNGVLYVGSTDGQVYAIR